MNDCGKHPFWDRWDKNKTQPCSEFICGNKDLCLDWLLSMSKREYSDQEAKDRRKQIASFVYDELT